MTKPQTESQIKRLLNLLRDHQWSVIGLLWVVAYILGAIGAAKQFAATGEKRSFSDLFYRAFQLFVMDDSMVTNGPLVAWELEIARFMAPAVSAYAAVTAFFAVFREQLNLLRLRFFRGHVVICGLGRKGFALACDFHHGGDRVVVIERDAENKGIATCQELGIIVLIGDATERSILEMARIAHASHLVAICGSDGTNAEIALQAYQIVQARPHHMRQPVRCLVHIVELRLCELLAQHRVFADFGDRFEATTFNIYQNSARMLFEVHPPDRGLIVVEDPRIAHLIIIGFGYMGECVALQMARTGHYANHRRPRITVIDSEAVNREKAFLSRYPQFALTSEVEFIDSGVDDPGLLEKLRNWGADPGSVTSVVIALDGDARALSCGLNILTRLQGCDVPVIVRMSDDAGLAALLEPEEGDAGSIANANIHPFGMPRRACTRRMLLNEDLDLLARPFMRNMLPTADAKASRRTTAPCRGNGSITASRTPTANRPTTCASSCGP